METWSGKTVVAVHAHPDDEALFTGGLLYEAAHAGADVHVITCTLGEEGEVIGEPYQLLTVDNTDQLGGFRIHELQRSLEILGCTGHFLGGAGRFRDSGMEGEARSNALINSMDEAAAALKELVEALAPDLLVTYDPFGTYGHRDHIAAHRLTHTVAGDVPVWWAVELDSDVRAGLAGIVSSPWRIPQPEEIVTVDHSDTVIEMDDRAYNAKAEAMKAHATQLWIADGSISDVNPHQAFAQADGYVFCLSNLMSQPLRRREHYQFAPSDYTVDLTESLA